MSEGISDKDIVVELGLGGEWKDTGEDVVTW